MATMSRLKRLIFETHQRSLWQALAVYIGASLGVLGTVDMFRERLGLPPWLFWVAFALLVTGLPVVIVMSLAREEVYGDEVPAEHAEAAAEEDRRLRVLTWRTAGLSLISALALWGVVAAVLLVLGVRVLEIGGAGIPISPNRIAVLPFEYSGSEAFDEHGEGVAEILSRTIDGAGELVTVDAFALLKYVEREYEDLDPEQGAEIARYFGAGRFILGSIREAGGSFHASATLYDLGGGRRADAEAAANEEAEVFGELIDHLAMQLLRESLGDAPERLTGAGAETTESLEAMKAYLQGEALARAGKFDSATVAYRRAVELDTTFAFAYYRLASNAPGGGGFRVVPVIESARRFSGRLSWRDSLLVEAYHATWVRSAYEEAEETYERLLAWYPDELEAWVKLSELLAWNLVPRGRRYSDLREVAERALALDPYSLDPNIALSLIAAFEGDSATAISCWERMLEAQPEGMPSVLWGVLLASLRGDAGRLERAIEELGAAGPNAAFLTGLWLLTVTDDAPTARRAFELLTEPRWPPYWRGGGHRGLMMSELVRGHWDAAQEEIAALSALDPVWGARFAEASSVPFMPVTSAEFAVLRDSLAAWRPEPGQRIERLFYLGLVNARLGEADKAEAIAAELEGGDSAFSGNLALTVRAQLAVSQRRYEEALYLLEQVEPARRWIETVFAYVPLERWLRAEVLYALARYEEALPWYEAYALSIFKPEYAVPAGFRMGEIHEQLGDPQVAARHYRHFIKRWEDCDPELQPWVDQARRALERLTGEL